MSSQTAVRSLIAASFCKRDGEDSTGSLEYYPNFFDDSTFYRNYFFLSNVSLLFFKSENLKNTNKRFTMKKLHIFVEAHTRIQEERDS